MKPRLLLTNDDGVDSPLLQHLAAELASDFTPVIVAPATEMSWAGARHIATRPVEAVRDPSFRFETYRVTGSPVDCVYIACRHLGLNPDLIVSGANFGVNAGLARLVFSGTVQAALAGARLKIPAVAVSIYYTREIRQRYSKVTELPLALYSAELRQATELIRASWKTGCLTRGSCTNINLPHPCPAPNRIRLAPIHDDGDLDIFEPGSSSPFKPTPAYPDFDSIPEETDLGAIGRDWITVTPLKIAFEDTAAHPALKKTIHQLTVS
jgi:5'/3'-nucleotidase SurE